jgi:hypothetical protein
MRQLLLPIKSLAIVGLGLFLLYSLYKDAVTERAQLEIRHGGILVEGKVTALKENDSKRKDGVWLLSYRFKLTDGRVIRAYDRKISAPGPLTPEAPIDVWHDRVNPNLCVTEQEIQYTPHGLIGFWGLSLLAVAFIVSGIWMFIAFLRCPDQM